MSKKGLKASQRAHSRLSNYHNRKLNLAREQKKWGKADIHFVRRNYHALCIDRQFKLGRKLTFVEKKKTYDDTVKDFF